MARNHIHTYETRYHAQATYSKAIRASGDLVFMQGQVGTLLDGTLIGAGDPGAQACRNIQHWMEEAGGCLKVNGLCNRRGLSRPGLRGDKSLV
jgi:enamine deaminase RidA (YjgF/YER057c/UK114 family)